MCNHICMNSNKESTIKKKSNRRWKVIFILLFIVDVILAYWLYGSSGYGIDLIKFSFLLLPIVNLMFCCRLFITKGDSLGLLRVGFILLIIVNVMFGYNVYDQERYGIGAGFLAVIPFITVLAINDLTTVLFYIDTASSGHS